MPTVESLQALRNDMVMKFSAGAAIFADYAAATITDIFDPTGATVQALPPGYQSAGNVTSTGLTTTRALTVSEVMSWQSTEAVRSDTDADKMQFKASFQATNPVTLALQENQLLATMPALGSRIIIDHSSSGFNPLRRVLLLGHDLQNDVIVGRFLPRMKISALGDQVWSRAQETNYDFTLDAYTDPTYGTASRYFIGGPGWLAYTALSAQVTTIAVTPPSVTLALNATQQLTVTATYSDSTTGAVTGTATYVSSAPAVATVSASGLITKVAAGTATITATFQGRTATCAVS